MAEKFSKLELVWRTRKGGGGGSQRDYLDFVIDGNSLIDLLKPGDNVGCLGWLSPEIEQKIVDELSTKRLSELGNNRYPIYICPECGDLGCGAITVEIEKRGTSFIWKNFGYENDYEKKINKLEFYKNIGPFEIEESEYLNVLQNRPRLNFPDS